MGATPWLFYNMCQGLFEIMILFVVLAIMATLYHSIASHFIIKGGGAYERKSGENHLVL